MSFLSHPLSLRRIRRSAGYVLSFFTFAPMFTACGSSDVVAPSSIVSSNAKVDRLGPTHEIRVLIDSSGALRGMLFAQIRGNRPDFVPTSDAGLGKKLNDVPASQKELVKAFTQQGVTLPVVFYEVPKNYKRLKKHDAVTSVPSVRDWNPDVDPLSPEDQDAYVNETLYEMSQAYNDGLEGASSDPGGGGGYETIRQASSAEARQLVSQRAGSGISSFAPTRSEAISTAVAGAMMRDDCTLVRTALAVAGIAAAATVAAAATGFIAATAPVATVIGGITIMVLPSASATWLAGGIALVSSFAAGASVGYAWRVVRQCETIGQT